MHESDEALVGRMLNGEDAALAALYSRRQQGIYRFALHMSGSHSVAEDVTQEVFLTLMERGNEFDSARGTVSAFLFGIARNHILRRLRMGRKLVSMEDPAAEQPAPGNQLEDLSRQETVDTVRRMILALPPKYREAVVLCDLHELDYVTAGAVMRCRTGTVRSRLHRGREMLQRKLEANFRSENARGGAYVLPAF
jgi:RNA polymerase sigma-70 factor (ECF subfamily)